MKKSGATAGVHGKSGRKQGQSGLTAERETAWSDKVAKVITRTTGRPATLIQADKVHKFKKKATHSK